MDLKLALAQNRSSYNTTEAISPIVQSNNSNESPYFNVAPESPCNCSTKHWNLIAGMAIGYALAKIL